MTATVAQALAEAQALGLDRLDAHRLLAWQLGQTRAWLAAHADAALPPEVAARIAEACARRAAGTPLAYLVGEQEFHGLTLQVDPRVLIPRPDTEVIVDWALELLADRRAPRVVDLGTGSGAIALAVKQRCPHAEVHATDLSRDALDVARTNAARLALNVTFLGGPWWAAVGGQRYDLALANPPYIAEGDPHLPALRHEPVSALTSGHDGLAALREIVDGAAAHLTEGAWLLLEHGYDQAGAVQSLLREAGYADIATRHDVGGQPRCTGGRRAGARGSV